MAENPVMLGHREEGEMEVPCMSANWNRNIASATSLSESKWSDTSTRAYQFDAAIGKESDTTKQLNKPMSLETESTEQLNKSKDKPDGRRKRICVTVGVITTLALIAAVGVGISYSLKPKAQKVERVEIVGEIVIREAWSDKLADNSSVDYREKKLAIETELDKGFKTGKLALIYDTVEVISFRPGSVVVDIVVSVNIPAGATTFANGTVVLSVEDSTSLVQVTGLVKDSITNQVNLNIDTDRINVRVSVTFKSTSPSSGVSTPLSTPSSRATVVPTRRTTTATRWTTFTRFRTARRTTQGSTTGTTRRTSRRETSRATVATPRTTTKFLNATPPTTTRYLAPFITTTTPFVRLTTIQRGSTARSPDICPCQNGGSCLYYYGFGDYKCFCYFLYTGRYCQFSIAATPRPWTTVVPGFSCRYNSYQCVSGACIPHEWVCDNRHDCTDGSDESPYLCYQNSTTPTTTTRTGHSWETSRTTSAPRYPTTPPWWLVNTTSTTRGWWSRRTTSPWWQTTRSPWWNATSTPEVCRSTHFRCGDGSCLPMENRCDGTTDCLGGEDERVCVQLFENGTSVNVNGEVRTLCIGSSEFSNRQVGESVCIYMGHVKLESVAILPDVKVPLGVVFYSSSKVLGYLGNFVPILAVDCAPLVIHCVERALDCGIPSVPLASNYIQYGTDSLPGQWPWQIELKRNGRFICGGTLINERWIVTATHCIDDYSPSSFMVTLGSYRRDRQEDGEIRRSVLKIIKHPNFYESLGHHVNDITLLFLNETVNYTDYIKPACVPREPLSGREICYNTGWGDDERGINPNILQQIRVTTVPSTPCRVINPTEDVQPSMVCAIKSTRYSPVCYGDSGGPLVCLNKAERWDLHGVTSFGPPSCRRGSGVTGVAVFSSIFYYKPWLNENAACRFTCDDGHCLFAEGVVCDGTANCLDGSDEGSDLCAESISCDFEYKNICGYSKSNYSWSGSAWVQTDGSYKYRFRNESIQSGLFMAVSNESTSTNMAVLRSPIINATSRPSCLRFLFQLDQWILPRSNTHGPLLQLWTIDSNQNTDLQWSVDNYFNTEWNFASVTLPAGIVRLEFRGGPQAFIDEVEHTENLACSPIECIGDPDGACNSLGFCMNSSLLCDSKRQCSDPASLDEDPNYCGASVNCTFGDYEYNCGYQSSTHGELSWIGGRTPRTFKNGYGNSTDFSMGVPVAYGFSLDATAELFVPAFQTSERESCLEFYYILADGRNKRSFAPTLALLNVSSNEELQYWSRAGDQGNRWRLAQTNIPRGFHNLNFRFAFYASDAGEVTHDIWVKVDDVRVISGACITSVVSCNTEEFTCGPGHCISFTSVCDGVQHCQNRIDELPGCIPDGSIRLVGGEPQGRQGRVEIYHANVWRTVCGSSRWGQYEANVVCASLGGSRRDRNVALTGAQFGASPAPMGPTFDCNGYEDELINCNRLTAWEPNLCDPNNVASVVCGSAAPRLTNVVRLQSFQKPWIGFVQIFYTEWHTICNNVWNDIAANVTCKMLGYSGVARTLDADSLGVTNFTAFPRSGVDGFTCSGNERFLSGCEQSGSSMTRPNCSFSEYAAVECIHDEVNTPPPPSSMRLSDGTESSGRLEIFYDNQWGTVCDDGVTNFTAEIICNGFGYSNGVLLPHTPPGSGKIWLDDVRCYPDNIWILGCRYLLGTHNCNHYEDVGVECFTDCDSRSMLCDDNKTCIYTSFVCDGYPDCPNGDDESTCEPDCGVDSEYVCPDGKCYLPSERCDGSADCLDGSDELGCVRINADLTVDLRNRGVWRPLCVYEEDARDIAEAVCRLINLGTPSAFITSTVTDSAWIAYPATMNHTTLPGFNVTYSSQCDNLLVTCQTTNCGVRGTNTPALRGEWPWLVRILSERSPSGNMCDGVLVESHWVLSSSSCVTRLGLESLKVGGGTWSESGPEWYSDVLKVYDEGPSVLPQTLFSPVDRLILLRLSGDSSRPADTSSVCMPNVGDPAPTHCYFVKNPHIIINNDFSRKEFPVTFHTSYDCSYLKRTLFNQNPEDSTMCIRYKPRNIQQGNSSQCSVYSGDGSPVVCRHPSGRWVVEAISWKTPSCHGWIENTVVPVRDSMAWISKITECPFRCANGECLFDFNSVCDGVANCPDGSDEGQVCDIQAACHFDYNSNCGYDVGNPQGYHWAKVRKGSANGVINDNTRGTEDGGYLIAVRGEALSVHNTDKAVLMSPATNASCLVFHFYMHGTFSLELDVVVVERTKNTTLLSFRGDYSYSWRQALLQINSTFTRPLRLAFNARNFTLGDVIAIDDVQTSDHCVLECGTDDFECANSFCLDSRSVCDGYYHCPDQSDEESCSVWRNCDFQKDVCGYTNRSTSGSGWLWSNVSGIPVDAPISDHTYKSPIQTPVGRHPHIRLVNGEKSTTSFSGRVEILHNGEWGTICDDGFGTSDARVVCKMLGYRSASYRCCSSYGRGTGRIWLDNLSCTGSETDIKTCRHGGWGVLRSCSHSEDVGVTCYSPITSSTDTILRLVNGRQTETWYSGRVEVFYNNEWGTVCDDGFGDQDARVLCKMLGYSNGIASCCAKFGAGTGRIWLDDLNCLGTEDDISYCNHNGWGSHNCGHSEDSGINCTGKTNRVTNRVIPGFYIYTTSYNQSLESQWFTSVEPVCLEFYYFLFGDIGYTGGLVVKDDGRSGEKVLWEVTGAQGNKWRLVQIAVPPGGHRFVFENKWLTGVAIDDVRIINGPCLESVISCDVTEYQCKHTTRCVPDVYLCDGRRNCPLGDDEITCNSTVTDEIRLMPTGTLNTISNLVAYVEIRHAGNWRPLLITGFPSQAIGRVACQQFGLSYDSISSRYASYSEYTWEVNLNCDGTEKSLLFCRHSTFSSTFTNRQLQVFCQQVPQNARLTDYLRLVNGEQPNEGRLEIRLYNEWGTICNDNVNQNEATAACRSMGFRGQAEILNTSLPGTGKIWLDDLFCFSSNFMDCSSKRVGVHDCNHYEDVVLRCQQICNQGYVLCKDGWTCVNEDWICDGDSDCVDGSDEESCNTCLSTQFTCDNYQCIPGDQRCDGVPNCDDASDETRCLYLTNENHVMVLDEDEAWKPLCGDASTIRDLGVDTCDYLGYRTVHQVTLGTNHVDGLIATRATGSRGLFAGFNISSSSSCNPVEVQCNMLECGVQGYEDPVDMAFFGKRARVAEWPWQVLIEGGTEPTCTGVLLNNSWVLAGYCVSYLPISNLTVRLGIQNWRVSGEHEVERSVARRYTNRIGSLLLLEDPVAFTPYVRPVCLPQQFDFTPTDCYETGWGGDEYDIRGNLIYDDFLQEANARIVTLQKCNAPFQFPVNGTFTANDTAVNSTALYSESYVCVHTNSSGGNYSRTCPRAGGKILVCKNRAERWEVFGVNEEYPYWAPDCSYSVYRSLTAILNWIEDKTACPFTCGDRCIYNANNICDGRSDCPNREDETTLCEPSVNCTFAYPNMCGYYNTSSVATSAWIRGSYDDIMGRFDDQVRRYATLDMFNTQHGYYLFVYSIYPGISPASVETPDLGEPRDHPRCLRFRLAAWTYNSSGLLFSVVAIGQAQNTQVLRIDGQANYRWELFSVNLIPGTRRVRFLTMERSPGFVAIDDVRVTDGLCGAVSCDSHEFRCSSGECVPKYGRCNNQVDCADGSDEEDCGESVDCDFEEARMCGYKSVSRYHSWQWGSGWNSPPYPFLSPYADHTLKIAPGHYVWPLVGIDFGSRAILVSPPFGITEDSCATFYYNLQTRRDIDTSRFPRHPVSPNALQVYTYSDNQKRLQWTATDIKIGRWRLGQINLRSGLQRLIFSTRQQTYSESLIANLDDIRILSGQCIETVSTCATNEFRCNSGECISEQWVCDSITDCPDSSDEERDCDTPLHPVRLTGGGVPSQGRVEILNAGRWGSVCDSYFSLYDIRVVCGMLNFSQSGVYPYDMSFGQGPPLWLYSVSCDGSENSLDKCMSFVQDWQSGTCGASSTAGLRCESNRYGTSNNVRLVGKNGWEGRLEIYHDRVWGSVCNRGWDVVDAQVVCRMMGYGSEAELLGASEFDDAGSNVPIWMSDVYCRGHEERLEECIFPGWDNNRCTHNQDVGVRCLGGPGAGQEISPRPALERIRLVDGPNPNQGRVEVQFGDIWGTICNDNVNDTEVKLICKTLGYSGGGEKLSDVMPGIGQIWLDDLDCSRINSSGEESVFSCNSSGVGKHNCDHLEDLVVRCFKSCGDRPRFTGPQIAVAEESQPDQWPWLGQVLSSGNEPCAAIIVNERFVITSSQCVTGDPGNNVTFLSAAMTRTVSEVRIHPGYSAGSADQFPRADIALLRLDQPVDIDRANVGYLCLPEKELGLARFSECYIAGWGALPGVSGSSLLRHAPVYVTESNTCSQRWGTRAINDTVQLCAEYLQGGTPICYGDIGGPLMCKDDADRWILAGVLSAESDSCLLNEGQTTPNVYTRISHFRDWIDETIRE